MFIYHLLLQAEVYETDGIVRKFVYTRNGETVTVKVHKSKFHISEDLGVLKIYVPKDRKDQELCFLQLLPIKLFNDVIMGEKTNSTLASDSEAVRIITALLMSSDEVVSDLLDDAGIIPVAYPDEFDIEASEQAPSIAEPTIPCDGHSQVHIETEPRASPREDRGQSQEESVSSPRSRLSSPTPPSSYRTNYRAATPVYRQPSVRSFSSRSPVPRGNEFSPFLVNSGQAEYCRLLNNIIAAAKCKRGGFPTQGAFNIDDLLGALPMESDAGPISYDLPFGVRSENQLAHDMKVGAAGELYVRSNIGICLHFR
jgi:hypothetical protein